MSSQVFFIVYVFVLGACVGSFLNVLIYRLPRGDSLWWPPSRCPQCEHRLAWYDNIPVLGWIFLGGKCRYCRKRISPQYPIIEAITGLLFAFYYWMFFVQQIGPCRQPTFLFGPRDMFAAMPLTPADIWPIYIMDMVLLAGMLAASVIDAELYIIPASIPWWIAAAAVIGHAIVDRIGLPGAQIVFPFSMSLSAGAAVGLLISIALLEMGIIPLSFAELDLLEVERAELEKRAAEAQQKGETAPEIPPEFTPAQVRAEMRKEMLFLIPPLLLAAVSGWMYLQFGNVHRWWLHAAVHIWFNAFLGSLLGAMAGAAVVWFTRIFGSYFFGREAMGLGDVHLMFGVGAVIGGGAATVAFFLAPFFGILVAIYMLFTGKRRQLQYGPYLSLATAFVVLFYCPIADYLRPGVRGLIMLLRQATGG
ncbi:MAG: prepilin peptidase [Tepidisphaeraceae bacterium]|jgi:leader peptidase (prepilin peptidase)/N-methyltransferase